MKECTCFLLFRIFAFTNSISLIRQKGYHSGIHLPQTTVPEYSNEEYSGDTNNLDDVHNLQTRGTTLSNRNMKLAYRAPRVETLTSFIQEAVKIINTYDDTAFEHFFRILDDEIRKYHYRGCKFSELTQNSNTRRLLAESFRLIRGKPVSFTKANINVVADMMRDEKCDKNIKELLDYVDSLYRSTKANFQSILYELSYYRNVKSMKTQNYLVQVIRDGLRGILFDHYTELNTNTRRELQEKIENLWKQLKNNASRAEMNDIPYTSPVIKTVVKSVKALKNPGPYSKNDPQMKLKNKSERIISSIEIDNENFHHAKSEINESGNEFWKPVTDYAADEIALGQSFDNSSRSNSIKKTQERHEEHNTQRYMTLYTEEISYKARTRKKTEIVPMSASVMTRRQEVKKRPTTMSTPREKDISSDETKKIEMLRVNHDAHDTKQESSDSSHDTESSLLLESKHKPRAKENFDKQRKHGKADKSRSKNKHKNAQIVRQYDAVIDVQLANTELLKSLGMFEPLRMDMKYDSTLYPKSAMKTTPLPIKPTTRSRSIREQAHIKPQKPTAPTKAPSRFLKGYKFFYRKQFDDSKRSMVPNEGYSVKQYKKDKNQKQKFKTRRSDNDTVGVNDFNKYVVNRINALEKEINELKQMNDQFNSRSRINNNDTDGVEVRNFTDKYEGKDNAGSKRKDMKGNDIERLLNENHDLINEQVKDENSTTSNTMSIESTTISTTSSEPNVIKQDAVSSTVIDDKNTSQVTNNNVTNYTKEINKEAITDNAASTVTSVITKLESVVTTPSAVITRRTMAYSESESYEGLPAPLEGNSRIDLDPFDHDRDGYNF